VRLAELEEGGHFMMIQQIYQFHRERLALKVAVIGQSIQVDRYFVETHVHILDGVVVTTATSGVLHNVR
jgi:hypothetical protein